tara:strand:+ start:3838 stop:4212 length:375 start_codon:yes stop_codon:yes gene_type:complete
MIQILLFSIYVAVMSVLILAVVDESISGVVILIIGGPITAIYLIFAIGAGLVSRPLRQNVPEKKGLDERGSLNPPPTQIKLGPVTLKELTPEGKRILKWIIYILIALNFIILPVIDISINEGWI